MYTRAVKSYPAFAFVVPPFHRFPYRRFFYKERPDAGNKENLYRGFFAPYVRKCENISLESRLVSTQPGHFLGLQLPLTVMRSWTNFLLAKYAADLTISMQAATAPGEFLKFPNLVHTRRLALELPRVPGAREKGTSAAKYRRVKVRHN